MNADFQPRLLSSIAVLQRVVLSFSEVEAPKPERLCRGCGKTVQDDSTNCAQCDVEIATKRLVEVARAGRVAGHTPEAIAKEAATHRKHAQAKAAWNPANQPSWLTEQFFSEKIQPATRASFSYGHRKKDWRIALVCRAHSRGLPSTSTTLAGAGDSSRCLIMDDNAE